MTTDYISREAAIEQIRALIDEKFENGVDDACYIVEHFVPAADVVEVVRCKDCRYYFLGYCTHFQGMKGPDKDGFCFLAERCPE